MFPLFPETPEQAEALGGRHGAEGFVYYRTERASHPRSATSFTWSSVDRIATFDAFAAVDLIGQRPLLMIVGREAVTAWMAVEAFQKASGPKQLVWIEGATHNDLYDKAEYDGPAVENLTDFYRAHLGVDMAEALTAQAG